MVKKYLEKHFSKDIADFTWKFTEYYNTSFDFFKEDLRRDMEKFLKGKKRNKIMVAGLDYWFKEKAEMNKMEQLENIMKKYERTEK